MSIFPKGFDPTYEDYVTKFLEYDDASEDALWDKGELLLEFTEQQSLEVITPAKKRKGLRSLASDVGKHHKTLERWRYTAEIFPPDKRIMDLSFSHHTAAAYSEDPHYWIAKAADEGWSKTQLLNAIKAAEHPEAAWVSKRLIGEGDLTIEDWRTYEGVHFSSKDFEIRFVAKKGTPTRFGMSIGEKVRVEVEARIKLRRPP